MLDYSTHVHKLGINGYNTTMGEGYILEGGLGLMFLEQNGNYLLVVRVLVLMGRLGFVF